MPAVITEIQEWQRRLAVVGEPLTIDNNGFSEDPFIMA
jgi:hypothetical protein